METIRPIDIKIASARIAALSFGDEKKPIMLALHGWLDNAASFIPLAPLLSDYHVIAIDFPGHGYSSHRPDGIYFHIADYIPETIAILDALGVETCSLLGHSLGAVVASLVAGTFTERIDNLILLDALGPFALPAAKLPALVRKTTVQYRQLKNKKPPYYKSYAQAVQARLQATPMSEEAVKLLVDRGLTKAGEYYTWRNDPRLMIQPLIMLTEEQVRAFLSKIRARSCFIRPNDGYPFPENILESRMAEFRHLSCYQIPGHHHIHMDNPQGIAEIIVKFLAL